MKHTVVVSSTEIQQAILAMVLRRPSTAGKFVGGVILVADPREPRAELRIKSNVILFDTEKAARQYAESPTPPEEGQDVKIGEGADAGPAAVLGKTESLILESTGEGNGPTAKQ